MTHLSKSELPKSQKICSLSLLPLIHAVLNLEKLGLCSACVRWPAVRQKAENGLLTHPHLWLCKGNNPCELHGCSFLGAFQGSRKLCSWWASCLLLMLSGPVLTERSIKHPQTVPDTWKAEQSAERHRVSWLCEIVPVPRPCISQSF